MQHVYTLQLHTRNTMKCDFDSPVSYDQMVMCCYFIWTSFVHHVCLCCQKAQKWTTYQHKSQHLNAVNKCS